MAKRTLHPCKHPDCDALVQERARTGLCQHHYNRSPEQRARFSQANGGFMGQIPVDKHDEYHFYRRHKRFTAAEAFALVMEGTTE